MSKLKFLIMLLMAGTLFNQCSKEPTNPDEKNLVRNLNLVEKTIVESDNSFGLKLFQKIIEAEQDKNIFISPLSVSMALGMTLNGANGETKQAMQQTLELAGLSDDEINSSYKSLMELLTSIDAKVQFQIANSIWYRSTFQVEQPFIDVNQNYFAAQVRSLDFSDPTAVTVINQWVSDNTHAKITEIIDSINPAVVMYLINAIYFKGVWTYQFNPSATAAAPFYLLDGSEQTCHLMNIHGSFNYLASEKFHAVDLPYGNEQFSMTIILPRQETELDEIIADLNPTNWNNWLGQFTELEGDIFLPRFKLEYEKPLVDVLGQLGMGVAFSDQANFTGINRNGGLFISEVKHKTFVEVNEEGTEAAAVTSVEMRATSSGQFFYFKVDHPFIFAIREKATGAILFIGKIVNPS